MTGTLVRRSAFTLLLVIAAGCEPAPPPGDEPDACALGEGAAGCALALPLSEATDGPVAAAPACSGRSDGVCPAGCSPCRASCGANQDIDCKLANGAVCSHRNQCRTACLDGRCCAVTACSTCAACTGASGTCLALPAGAEDNVPAGSCTGAFSCDGAGGCKKDNGSACAAASECASGSCLDGHCCSVAACPTCTSCTGPAGTCAALPLGVEDNVPAGACANHAWCDGAGRCERALGATCAASADCLSGFCVGGICCNSACAGAGRTCATGQCKLLDRQVCNTAADCASGVCSTFYFDWDLDQQGRNTPTNLCGLTPYGAYRTTTGDCCDTDSRVKTITNEFWSTTNNCGHYDYNCSGAAELESTQVERCNLTDCRGGWVNVVPACGTAGIYRECHRTGPGGLFCDIWQTTRLQRCR
jgi:hypothetical protein